MMHGVRRVAHPALPGLAMLLAWSCPTDAVEYFVRPTISGGLEYDDNRRLESGESEDTDVLTQRYLPALLFGIRTPAVNTSGVARAEIIQASDDELDRTNGFMRLNTIYTTPRDLWDVEVEWRQDSTLTSLIDRFGQADGADVDEDDPRGEQDEVPQQNVQRTRVRFDPTWTRVLTPRLNLELGYRFRSTMFEDIPETDVTRLEDSTSNRVRGELAYQLTPIDTLIGRVGYGHFDSDSSVFDQGSVLGGLGHSFSETFDAELLLGATYTTFEEEARGDDPGDSGDDTTFAVYLTAEKELRTGSVTAFFQRDVGGGGFGFARRGTQLDVRWDLTIVPDRWFFSFAGQAFRTDSIGDEVSSDDRSYAQIVPRLRWQFSRQLALDISYRYRVNDRDGPENTAESNAGIIGLVFTLDPYTISR